MLEPKKISREKLYFNKYKYRVNVTMDELRWFYPIWWMDKKRYSSCDESMASGVLNIIEPLIEFMKSHRMVPRHKREAEIRKSHIAFTVYTNKVEIIEELYDIIDTNDKFYKVKTDFTEVAEIVPEGVMYFVKTPPGNYRAYFKEIYGAPISLKEELIEFFDNSKSFRPSGLLKRSLYNKRFNFRNFWVEKQHYFDCDNEEDISYFMLMYPEIVRKIYKLEQKPKDTMIE